MPNRTFVLGDIHGAHKALSQVLERSSFDETDHLICLGDVCDGWPETKQCIDKLMQIRQLTFLLGNHDYWALQWMIGEEPSESWTFMGGDATVSSYSGIPDDDHIGFLKRADNYLLQQNKLFVHAGIRLDTPLENQTTKTFLWDRDLATQALGNIDGPSDKRLTSYDEIYIGHTPIHNLGYKNPIKVCEVWFMDTGAGWDGCLSMMDIDSKEVFTSDLVPALYPDHSGRF